MPYSYNFFDQDVLHFVESLKRSEKVLDVGPGAGKYGKLLKKEGRTIEAVEIHAPYVDSYHLKNIYDEVHIQSVTDFPFTPWQYDLVIMGDVLEHLEVDEAQVLLTKLKSLHIPVLVLVPYSFKQGESFGNKHEEHKQDDLTEKLFLTRYPEFKIVFNHEKQGVFFQE